MIEFVFLCMVIKNLNYVIEKGYIDRQRRQRS